MVPFQRYRVAVGERRIHVMETGEGIPVLMVHGNPMWGFLYRRVATALAKQPLRLIMPDLPGLGFSDRPPYSWHRLDNHGACMAGLIDALGLERLLLVCHDWGGPISLRALAERPGKLAGVVVLNTVVDPPRPGFRPTSFHRFANMPLVSDTAFRLLGFPQNVLHRVQSDPSTISGEVARAYRFPLRGWASNAAPLALARMVPTSLDHRSVGDLKICGELLSSLKIPAVIVWGDRDPILGGALKRVTRLLPQARVVRAQAGHYLQEEVPESIAEAVIDVFRASQ